jgi:DNA-binding NarL/FixJ family response regulator
MRARPLLSEAVQLAESIEALWLRDLAHAELAVAGGRRRRRGEPEQLTPQEQRVAELARTGMSNKEIAQLLWVSVSTVETHLQQVYAKLGVRSRRQLMTNGDGSRPGTP